MNKYELIRDIGVKENTLEEKEEVEETE